jgi:hypothetical protein
MPMLLAAVDTLSAWSDDVGLSYWHSADSLASIEYHLSGRLAGDAAVELELVPPSTARDLVVGIEGRARASGLDQIVTEAIDGRRLDGVAALRTHKLWASGSYDQIRTFAESLGEVESRARVEELVIAFASQPEGMSAWGQVSASYVVVTESAEEER